MKQTCSVEIAAPPHAVFRWVTEPDKLAQWIAVLESSETIEDRPEHVGSRFRQTFREHGREFTMEGVTTHWQQDRAVTVELTSSMMDMTIAQDLEPISTGTRLTQRTDLRFKGVMKVMGWLMCVMPGDKGRAKMEADFAKLKALCEADATHSDRAA